MRENLNGASEEPERHLRRMVGFAAPPPFGVLRECHRTLNFSGKAVRLQKACLMQTKVLYETALTLVRLL